MLGRCRAWAEPRGPHWCAARARTRGTGVGQAARSWATQRNLVFQFPVKLEMFIQFSFELNFKK
jgi:hypothetical protein